MKLNTILKNVAIKNAIKFSHHFNLLSKIKFDIINNHIDKINIISNLEKLFKKKQINNIINFMKSDKKNNSEKINLILIKDFGKIITNFQISPKKLKEYLFNF